jgi:hypothetical protein
MIVSQPASEILIQSNDDVAFGIEPSFKDIYPHPHPHQNWVDVSFFKRQLFQNYYYEL